MKRMKEEFGPDGVRSPGSRTPWRAVLGLGLGVAFGVEVAVLASAAPPASATEASPCEPAIARRDLVQPRMIRPVEGVLDTRLRVGLHEHSVPAWNRDHACWARRDFTLRTYFAPGGGDGPEDSRLEPSIPGPTLRVRKAYLRDPAGRPGPDNPEVSPGTRIRVRLENRLPNYPHPDPDEPYRGPSGPAHRCDPQAVRVAGETGEKVTLPESFPECFHGPEVTNLHFHGSHASPQPPQDFVLLEVYSSEQETPPPPPESVEVAHGSYRFEFDPLPWNQAEGTHWYHPHKHGATTIQVLNGMAGAFLVHGPFDDWLYGAYDVDPADEEELEGFDKVLVLQQIWDRMNFFREDGEGVTWFPPELLVNGQAEPVIRMRPGEVQRWRIVSATMMAPVAQLNVRFPSFLKVQQIAQDGVRFAPENWEAQPLLTGSRSVGINLSPAQRVDVLVQAPPEASGSEPIGFTWFVQMDEAAERASDEELPPSPARPELFHVEVAGEPVDMELPCPFGEAGECAEFPAMPWYLRDVEPDEVVRTRTVAASGRDPESGAMGIPTTRPLSFWLNGSFFDPGCANQTAVLGTAEEWTLTNDSLPHHPIHVHTNPFQLVSYGGLTFPKPIWHDTVALPRVRCEDAPVAGEPPVLGDREDAAARCPATCATFEPRGLFGLPPGVEFEWTGFWRTKRPEHDPLMDPEKPRSVCGCCSGPEAKSARIRLRFEDYTGRFVYHCHFLAHEDRGMMHIVQTVCPEGTAAAGGYGAPSPDGRVDDCSRASSLAPLPECGPDPPPGGTAHDGAGEAGQGAGGAPAVPGATGARGPDGADTVPRAAPAPPPPG